MRVLHQNSLLRPGAQHLGHGFVCGQSHRDRTGFGGRSILHPLPQLIKQVHRLPAVAAPAMTKSRHAIVAVEVSDVGECMGDFLVVVKSAVGGDGGVRLRVGLISHQHVPGCWWNREDGGLTRP